MSILSAEEAISQKVAHDFEFQVKYSKFQLQHTAPFFFFFFFLSFFHSINLAHCCVFVHYNSLFLLHHINCRYTQPRKVKQSNLHKNCALLGYYAASSGKSLPMFWPNLTVPSSWTLEDGTVRLGQNISKELPLLAA